MRRVDLEYSYPEELVAIEPKADFRTLLSRPGVPAAEIKKSDIFDLFQPQDVLVINDTRVEARRVVASGLEILFVKPLEGLCWEVLFPARGMKVGESVSLPLGISMKLLSKGLPQQVELSEELSADFFDRFGEPALPPYIQKARGENRTRAEDMEWYQTAWARERGSAAAPTASLHFTRDDLGEWQMRGVKVCPVTLHVGLGTFLPVKAENLGDHKMHGEEVRISAQTWSELMAAKERGSRIWALGTTATRAIEGQALGHLRAQSDGGWAGSTDLFIMPGFEFKYVGGLLTNFHQPGSTLMALVSAFAGLDRVREAYAWAIERRFRLFSYGDLSIWLRE